jgi:signal transduction histidine kinase
MPLSMVPMSSNRQNHVLLAYVADLELEVDHLRKQCQFVQQETCEALKRIQSLCTGATMPESERNPLAEIHATTRQLATLLRDSREPSGYHPAHDQVIAIAVRPLIEQVFRWQQRLLNAPHVALRLDLQCEHVEWFPARLRHILDNLISNALKYRDSDKGETRVTLALRALPSGYELRVSDNGMGMPPDEGDEMVELFHRSAPARAAGLGVGLPVVKLLVEQSGGTLSTQSGDGQGTTFVAVLPRYGVDDFLT